MPQNSTQRSATMADVARLAGVGTMTVSRLLTGSAHVSQPSATRIHRAIKQLNYRPNQMARNLRSQRSQTIGIILPCIHDTFFATCAHAISLVARQHNYSVIISTSSDDPQTEYNEACQMVSRHVEGILIIPAPHSQLHLHKASFESTRIVTFDRPAGDADIDSVLVQNRNGAALMTTHLLEHGHKRIAFIGLSRDLYTMKTRYAGYRRSMLAAGLTPGSYHQCLSCADALPLLRALLAEKDPPTAIFTANNISTRYLLGALYQLGISVPSGIAIAGFDDMDTAEFFAASLTAVRQPTAEIGRAAATMLFDRILNKGRSPAAGRVILPVDLVLRSSCGCDPRSTQLPFTDALV